MYKYCLKHGFFPDEWKTDTIITIPKPSLDHTQVTYHTNTRPRKKPRKDN